MTPPIRPERSRPIEQFQTNRRQQALGQAAPSATSWTTLYTCPKKYMAYGRVFIVNAGVGAASTYRVAIRGGGAALTTKHYIVYDRPIDTDDDHHSVELTLAEDDIVAVYAGDLNLAFNFIGYTEPQDRP